MKRINIILILLIALLIAPGALYAQTVLKVGIVKDASGDEFQTLSNLVKAEITALKKGKPEVVFKELSAEWNPEKVQQNLQTMLKDPDISVVVALGFISSDMAAQLAEHPKPIIVANVLDQNLQNLPLRSNQSTGINNFTWIESFIRLKSDMLAFSQTFEFDHLSVFIPQELYEEFPILDQFLTETVQKFKISIVPVNKNGNLVSQIPSNTDAAFVFPLIQHSQTETMELFASLNKDKIPSLAVNGIPYLEMGATITFTPQFSFLQLARQVALLVSKVGEGTNLSEIPINMDAKTRTPIVNMESLHQIEQFPKWSMLDDAILMNVAKIPGEELTLQQAIAEALENNLQNKITNQDFLLAKKDVRIARSNVLPQIEVSGTAVQLSTNLVESSMGQRGEFTITGSASLKQVIYSEAVFANIAIKKLVAENAEHHSRQAALDIVLDVSKAYVNLLFAKNNLQIQNENVNATLQNLEMAKAKEVSGEGSVTDVNRWTSEQNLNRIDLNDAQSKYKSAMYQLNELLNLPISNPIATSDAANIGETIVLNQHILDTFFGDQYLTEKYSDFLISEMFMYSPELQQVLNAGRMIDRKKSMQIRRMFLPEIALVGGADQAFVREGTIRNPQLPVPYPPDDITWNVGVRLSIPIFEGGKKSIETQRATIEQDKIAWQQEDLLNNLEVGIRANVQFLQASYRKQDLSENAARAAEANFKLIQDAYSQGVVSVIQLIDAQNVMIKTKHLALSAKYQFILDYIKTERLQGKYSFLDDETNQALHTNRLLNYLNDKNDEK
ncbi:MAG: TolC family protein [Balneolaceae bacterium]